MTCERLWNSDNHNEHSFDCLYDNDVRLVRVAIYHRSICLNSDCDTHQASGLARCVRSINVGCAIIDLLTDVFDNLVFILQYASSAYDITCARPTQYLSYAGTNVVKDICQKVNYSTAHVNRANAPCETARLMGCPQSLLRQIDL